MRTIKTTLVLLLALFVHAASVQAQSRRPIDPQHPLWLIHIDVWNNANPQSIIDLIPDDVKPFVCFNLSLSCQYDKDLKIYKMPQNAVLTFKSWASVCCANNVWFTLQPASGGHTHIQDNDLDTFEYFFKHYPNFLGWNYAEQFWGFDEPNDASSSTQASRIALFAKLVPMHHKYGGFLTISFCGNIWSHALNPIGMMKRNNDLLNACKNYPEACLWLYKYTTSSCWYNNESVTLSPFISGLATNYGVRYDNCGWNGALDAILKEGHGKKYPASCGYGTVLEQTAINGGAVWDGPELIWTEDFRELNQTTVDGYRHRNWGTYPTFDNGWLDLFRKIIDGTVYIPSRQEVIARNKVVIINDNNWNDDGTKYAAPGNLYDGLYKQNDFFNRGNGQFMDNLCFFKKTGRYQAIPVVIDLYDNLANSIPVKVKRTEYGNKWTSEWSKVNEFNSLYPEVSTGDLFVARHNNQLITYYPFSYFRSQTTASAEIPLQYNTCNQLGLVYGKLSNGVINEYSDHIDVYLNNYRNDTTTLVTDQIIIRGASSKPSYSFTKRVNAQANNPSEVWNASSGTYTLSIAHCGPVELTINCSGNGTNRKTNVNRHSNLSASLPLQPADYIGDLIHEAEDIDYKDVGWLITHQYNQSRNYRGHSGMGMVEMGTNTNAALRDKVKIKHAGEYAIRVRYTNSTSGSAFNLTTQVNGVSKTARVETTATNEWKEAVVQAQLKNGENIVIIQNTAGKAFTIDCVTYSPLDQSDATFDLSLTNVNDGTLPPGWVANDGNEEHSYPNTYYSGPRNFDGFSGDFDKAVYWRNANESIEGTLTYGAQSAYPLTLASGDYKLSFNVIAWKGQPKYAVRILDADGNVVADSEKYSTTINVDGKRTAVSGSTTEEFIFSVSSYGNYRIQFHCDPWWNELLLSACKLEPIQLSHVRVVSPSKRGTATASITAAEPGTLVTLTATPADFCTFEGWRTYNDGSITINSDGTFILPDHDVVISPIFKDETVDYELDLAATATGYMPEGWIATDGTDVHAYPNRYDLGPRIFEGFTGYQGKALYWRNTSATYGTLADYPLTLTKGNYCLSFANAAWKASPAFSVQILDSEGNVIAESDSYTSTPCAEGNFNADLSTCELRELNFHIDKAGTYQINFLRKGNGYDEYLILDCYLNYEYEMGDVNMDKSVDISDVVMTVNHILGSDTQVNLKGIFKYGDMDQSGTIDISDVVAIVNKILQ